MGEPEVKRLEGRAQIFISSTLKTDSKRGLNERLCAGVERAGLRCFLPQRDVNPESPRSVFEQNIAAIRNADALLLVVEDENANLGVEAGFAYGIDKRIVILVDKRHRLPGMLSGMDADVFRVPGLEPVKRYIDELIQRISGRSHSSPDLPG